MNEDNSVNPRDWKDRVKEKESMQTNEKINKIIEDLAMAIIHSEQGEYAKSEKFVKEKIDKLLSLQKQQMIEKGEELKKEIRETLGIK